MAEMTCPICGELFNEEWVEYLDNGNPACPHCVVEERKKEKYDNSIQIMTTEK